MQQQPCQTGPGEGASTRVQTKVFYESSNGDRWLLARDVETSRVYVQHQANLPSGGHVTKIEVSSFLAAGAAGPEHQALRRLVEDTGR